MKTKEKFKYNCTGNERGAVLVLVALLFVVLVGMVAFAVDINHLKVVENELQNAADAGALAGALYLYKDPDGVGPLLPGEEVNLDANQIAHDTAEENFADSSRGDSPVERSVEVNWTSGNTGDVQRGHWSFVNHKFTPLNATLPVSIWGVPDDDLDRMDGTYEYPPGSGLFPQNVNAVKVTARRESHEAESFFAPIYGFFGFQRQASAVAYIGFSGSLGPLEADMPIVICNTSLQHGDCNIGRMINSGNTETTNNTAAWAEMDPYAQSEVDSGQCNSGTNSNTVKGLVTDGCDGGGVNPSEIEGGNWLDANNGDIAVAFNKMKTCWEAATGGVQPWEMTLPVVECDGHGIENCVKVIGAVTVNMLLMTPPSVVDPLTVMPATMDDPDNPDFPTWDSSTDCGFFDDLSTGLYNGISLSDNYQSTVLPLLPGEDYDNGVDPWLIEDRWNGVASSAKEYTLGMARWDCFANHFGLQNNDGTMAPLAFKSMYFMPSCEHHEPAGTSNGPNFGVRAKFPVLVD